MNTTNKNILTNNSPDEAFSLDSALDTLIYQLQKTPVHTDAIKSEIIKIQEHLSSISAPIKDDKIKRLLSVLKNSSEEIKSLLLSYLKAVIPRLDDKWTAVKYLLSSEDNIIILKGFEFLQSLARSEILTIDPRIIRFFAAKHETFIKLLGEKDTLKKISEIFSYTDKESGVSGKDAVLGMYLGDNDINLKILAAKILDLREAPVTEQITEQILGKAASKIITPYLAFTRASYQDLLSLILSENKIAPVIESLIGCEAKCKPKLIREVIAKLGWKSVNYGLSVKHYTGISFNGSLPLFMTENEATLFEQSVKAQRISTYYIFTAHGGTFFETGDSGNDSRSVALFRSYNMAHAKLLEEILDVVPLTPETAGKILSQLDSIVSDFITLFNKYTEECKILPEVYGKIKNAIINELENNPKKSYLSSDATRLIQMFEDPKSLGEVHTLHGLKRYLHQRGLQLGFKLVDRSRSPNQCITLVLTSASRVLTIIQKINFANFEPLAEERFSFTEVPYPIKVVTEAFERQLLYGQENFPSVNIFCYGNEVHYFIWFRNHPVFIRIDYSPPLQGGMIDLQYFGVSNYEIADHPNIYLDAIKYFFQYLEFDVKLEGTHIQARYDKERALDLSQLCERIEYLFCLSAYLMDLDWVIGSFNLTDDAKKMVIKAWAEFFGRWGILPLSRIISKDRLGVIMKVFKTPEGEFEQLWPGEGKYRDRCSIEVPEGFFDNLFDSADNLGLKVQKFSADNFNQTGQLFLEKRILNYLREALISGEIRTVTDGFQRNTEDLFRKIHEVYIFKEILCCKDRRFSSAVILAKVTTPLEQTLRFQTTGTLESFTVQSAILPLQGQKLKLFVLRDSKNIIRLAFYVLGSTLFQKRKNKVDAWWTNAEFSPLMLRKLLRYNNYTSSASEPEYEEINEEIRKILDELRLKQKQILKVHIPGEKIVRGLRASPGRAAGRALLGTCGRLPEDFNEHIFIALSVSPDDNTILFHSAGIVATSGGILSHAGLIATQFNKPAIIIPGEWKHKADGSLILLYHTSEYSIDYKVEDGFNISVYYDLKEQENQIKNGDLVVLDANDGSLQVLGQDRDSVTLFEDLKSLGKTNEEILRVNDVKELLILRGRKLHIRHRIEKLLKRIKESILSRYAVQEILIGDFLEGSKSTTEEKAFLLSLILENEEIAGQAEKYLQQTVAEIENKFLSAYAEAEKEIPLSRYPFEVVMHRLRVLQLYEIIKSVVASSERSLDKKIILELKDVSNLDKISQYRLKELRSLLINRITELIGSAERKEYLRHLFRQASRIDILLNTPDKERLKVTGMRNEFEFRDEAVLKKLEEKFIIKKSDGALDLAPMIGWKAANLAELEHFGGKGLIPSWFAITDKAFQRTLDGSIPENYSLTEKLILKGTPLREAIDRILLTMEINNRVKSLHIRELWNSVSLDEEIQKEIIDAYTEIENMYLSESENKPKEKRLFVAIRSSSCEEDAEIAARAGEFETYLFIKGKYSLIEYLKRTWSGLWTERAIHNRAALGYEHYRTKGGVIVQRIVNSRISGVLQTINVAKGDLKEIIINAGLGLGEGVVSGIVSADQIIVSKEGDLQKGPLHFNYVTADKKEQIVYNQKAGSGTVITSTLYHQRFRPALEYVELCELVAIASGLEDAYGYPLDIEFGIEDTRLWILQVRPVATFLPALKETINHYPLRILKENSVEEKLK